MFESVEKVLLWLGGVIAAGFGWFLKRQDDRIKKLEDNTVSKPEFLRALDGIDKKADLMHGQNQTVLNRIDQRIDTLLLNATAKKDE